MPTLIDRSIFWLISFATAKFHLVSTKLNKLFVLFWFLFGDQLQKRYGTEITVTYGANFTTCGFLAAIAAL